MRLVQQAASVVLIGVFSLDPLTRASAAPPVRLPAGAAAIQVADTGANYALLGFQLGMTPDAIIGVAKAAGWKYHVRQGSLPSATAYVDQIAVEAPFFTTVEFSAATGKAVRIDAKGKTVEVLKEKDELFQAAVAKWGEPLQYRGDGTPKYLEWADRNGLHPTYGLSVWAIQEPGHVELVDEPARAASAAFLAGPPKTKSSL